MPYVPESLLCGKCGQLVPDGGAHIAVHPAGPQCHVMYCPECCPYHAAATDEEDAA